MRLFNQLKLRYKLLTSFSLVLTLFLVIALVVLNANNRTRDLSQKVEVRLYPALSIVQAISADFGVLGDLYPNAIMFKDKKMVADATQVSAELKDKIRLMSGNPLLNDEASRNLALLMGSYLTLADSTANAMISGVDFSAVMRDMKTLGDTTGQINEHLGQLETRLRAQLTEDLNAIDQLALNTTRVVWGVTSAVLLLALGLSFLMTRVITGPLFRLIEAMKKVREGDMESRVPAEGRDEIALMGEHFNYMLDGLQERERIKDTFKRYVAHSIVDEVLENPDKLELGGEIRYMTVIFSDIAGFSTFAETMPPTDLVIFLNEYFDEMVKIILEYGGTFDKFEGDLIMAFWGAPAKQPDHAVLACRACIAMQKRIRELQASWSKRNLPIINARIGINSGEMLVGNLGTQEIMTYTVMGDAVNMASRLESCGKEYGTYLTVSERTFQLVNEQFTARELDLVRVKGKERPVKIYQLQGEIGTVSPDQVSVNAEFEAGINAYRRQQWAEAEKCFLRCLDILPGDGPSKTYIERCRLFQEKPPRKNWDGVFTFKTK